MYVPGHAGIHANLSQQVQPMTAFVILTALNRDMGVLSLPLVMQLQSILSQSFEQRTRLREAVQVPKIDRMHNAAQYLIRKA